MLREGALLWMVMAAGCAAGQDGGAGGSSAAGSGAGPVSCTEGLSDCDGQCVDVTTDPANCGQCGRTCVIPDGLAACMGGKCAVDSCEVGYADCDGDVDNGCELEAACQDGDSCTTSCDSIGSLGCADICDPICELPPESCNLLDDDCNELCDDGAISDCRVGVHRANGPNGHFYSTDDAEASSGGNTIEALNYFYLYGGETADLQPFFRCDKGGGSFFMTTATDCEMNGVPVLTVGFISATEQCGATPLHRLQSPSATHFYTTSAAERDNAINNLGFTDEGVAGWVWAAP